MKTFSANSASIQRSWYMVDASDQTLGRLASEIAHRLRGKHKAEYTPHADTGDYIVVINAAQIKVTGKKLTDKYYHRHSGYPGGLKSISLEKLLEKAPGRALETAVKGMLPKNRLGRRMFSKLKVYAGAEHPHQSQQPELLDFSAQVPAHQQPAKFVPGAAVLARKEHTIIPGSGKSTAAQPTAAEKAATPDAPGLQSAAKVTVGGKKFKRDDLKIVEGIGPKIEELLHQAGIKTWAELAASDAQAVKDILDAAGSRFSVHDPGTWGRQAQMCVDEQWEELTVYQDELDGGKEVS